MKSYLSTALFSVLCLWLNAQVQINKPINLNGGTTDRRITNLADPTAADQAVNAGVVQTGALVFAAETGAANAYVVNLSPAVTTYTAGMIVNFTVGAGHANTGPSTLQLNNVTPAKPIKKFVTNDVASGDIVAGQMVSVIFDGANFQLLGGTPSGSGNYIQNQYSSAQTANFWTGNAKISPTSASWQEGLQFYMPTTSTWGGLRWSRNRGNQDGNFYIGYTALDATDDLVFGAGNGGAQLDNILRLTKTGLVGIGTTVPRTKFHVALASAFIDDAMTLENYSNTATTATGIGIKFKGGAGYTGSEANKWAAIYGINTSTNGYFNNMGIAFYTQGDATGPGGDPLVTATEKMRIKGNGNIGIGVTDPAKKLDVNGEIRASGGILFGTDVAAANTLSDYEEGTWTPIVTGSGGGTRTSAAANQGWYVKVGKLVTFGGTLSWSGGTAPSGMIKIIGLPYTCTGGRGFGSAGVSPPGSITTAATYTTLELVVDPGNNFIWLIQSKTSGYDHSPTIENTGTLYGFGGSYMTN